MRVRGRRPVNDNYAKHSLECEVRFINGEIPFLKSEIQRLKESLPRCKDSIVKCGNFEFVIEDINENKIKKQIEDYEKLIEDYTRYLSDISSVFEKMGWK
jgi:prefoldin subunit 5